MMDEQEITKDDVKFSHDIQEILTSYNVGGIRKSKALIRLLKLISSARKEEQNKCKEQQLAAVSACNVSYIKGKQAGAREVIEEIEPSLALNWKSRRSINPNSIFWKCFKEKHLGGDGNGDV